MLIFAEMLVTDTEDIDIQKAEDISLTAASKTSVCLSRLCYNQSSVVNSN